jgi:Fe-S cluster biogenesis protein NfuA
MFIQTEATPNPATLKFIPGVAVLEGAPRDMPSAKAAEASPLASAIFGIGGISGVFFGPDFISVTKSSGDWQYLKPAILGVIMEHFTSGAPILASGAGGAEAPHDEFFAPEHAEIVAKVKDLLETRVRPAVAADGGDIVFRGFKDGVVFLNMKGACSGCPSSTATLKRGVQNLICHFVPEVTSVEQI